MSDRPSISRRDLLLGRLGGPASARPDTFPEPMPGQEPPPPELVVRYPTSSDDLSRAGGSRSRVRGTIPVHRPPGAVREPDFLAGCTRCDACIKACPRDAITHAGPRLREAAGTPVIDASSQPCMMCEDFPCIEACEPGVLTSLVPPIMGTASIQAQTCIAHQGGTCSVCIERCPVPDAITTTDSRPVVDETRCTGCGVCHHVCPAPFNAVLLMPSLSRPPRPGARADDRSSSGSSPSMETER